MSGYSQSVNLASDQPDRTWYELSIDVHAEAVEPVSELLGRYGFNEGVAIDEPYRQDDDGDNLEVDIDKPFTVRTWVADSDYDPSIIEDIRAALWHLGMMRPVSDLRVSSLAEEDWANAWKEHFTVHRISECVVVRPPWLEYQPQGEEVVVELDPGMAFGTGLHPSTRLSMLGVEEVIEEGSTVLDVGTGSGILAIAALKLGAAHVDAVDVETVAVRAAEENARRNGVTDRVDVRLGSVGVGEPFQGVYDVVLANIIARVLIELADGIVDATKPGGAMVLAGIIQEREEEVAAAFEARGATVFNRRQHEDWVSLVLRRAV
ncbi:MAG: 50S ribosomal protein L11 methyltransferase [Chloroflexota bacterium]|nr:50S ribosomal protein L11 methyltransferase [Chloroflexota bacterium]